MFFFVVESGCGPPKSHVVNFPGAVVLDTLQAHGYLFFFYIKIDAENRRCHGIVVKAPLLLLVVLMLIGAALPSFNQQWSVARALLGEYRALLGEYRSREHLISHRMKYNSIASRVQRNIKRASTRVIDTTGDERKSESHPFPRLLALGRHGTLFLSTPPQLQLAGR